MREVPVIDRKSRACDYCDIADPKFNIHVVVYPGGYVDCLAPDKQPTYLCGDCHLKACAANEFQDSRKA
jgi:hypothetical protein